MNEILYTKLYETSGILLNKKILKIFIIKILI